MHTEDTPRQGGSSAAGTERVRAMIVPDGSPKPAQHGAIDDPLRGAPHYDRTTMTEPVHDLAAARRAWRSLERAGGLVSNADLRVRWGGADSPLTRQTVQKLTAREDFPRPVIRGGRGVPDQWLAAEVDDWRRRYDAGIRPGRKPRAAAEHR